MLNAIIIVLILIGLIVHRDLSTFWEQGRLPYPMGFLLFANSFAVICFVSFVWMFGVIAGVIVFILCYFQIVYSAGLWVFLIPGLISMHRNRTIPTVNLWVYGGFSFLVMIIAVLAIVNFFVSPYKSMWELMKEDVWIHVLVFLGILLVGNIVRIAVMSRMMKK